MQRIVLPRVESGTMNRPSQVVSLVRGIGKLKSLQRTFGGSKSGVGGRIHLLSNVKVLRRLVDPVNAHGIVHFRNQIRLEPFVECGCDVSSIASDRNLVEPHAIAKRYSNSRHLCIELLRLPFSIPDINVFTLAGRTGSSELTFTSYSFSLA